MQVLSESAVQAIVDRARARTTHARQVSSAAKHRLTVLKLTADEAAERARKLCPDPFAPERPYHAI